MLSKNFLLLFDNNGREYVLRIREGAMRGARNAGVQLHAENLYETRRTVEQALGAGDFGGVILTPPLSDDRRVLTMLERSGTPYVRIAPLLDTARGHTVAMDEFEAARAIVSHMLAKGHRRIGFVRGPTAHLVSIRRFNGYAAAIGGRGMRIDPALIVDGDFSRASGRAVASTLFAAQPTAIFASNDEMAVGVIEAAAQAGISIPAQISIVGFDDNAVCNQVRPRLTSVRQPLEEMGARACEILAQGMRFGSTRFQHLQEPFQIVERDSVAQAAQAAA